MKIRARAPLRLGIAGGGTDLSPFCDQHGGVVLNATIDMYAHAVLEPLEDGQLQFIAADRNEGWQGEAVSQVEIKGDLLLHKGVYNRIVRQFNGGEPLPVRLTTFSDAVAGSGLGTSSTMVVAMVQVFAEWLSLPLGEYDIAHMAYEIERLELGLAGGKQDQYAAAFGGFNFMEFYADNRVIVNPLRIKSWILSELESSIVLYYTGQSRESAAIIADQVKNVVHNTAETTKYMFKMKEDAYFMKECLLKGNIEQFGYYLDKSWSDKKNLSSAITNPMIDGIYDLAKSNGAFAGKVSGAGGGGFMMFLAEPENRLRLIEALSETPGKVMSCHFVKWGSQGWCIV